MAAVRRVNGWGLSRLWLFPVILAFENTVAVQIPHPWYRLYLYRGVPLLFGVALLFFGRVPLLAAAREKLQINWKAAWWHAAAFVAFVALELFLNVTYSKLPAAIRYSAIALCLALIPALVALLVIAFLPGPRLRSLLRELGPAWGYATVLTILVIILREVLRLFWASTSSRVGTWMQDTSFGQASGLLRFFYPNVISLPAPHILGTPRFLVTISGVCSGIEGLALISAFLLVWSFFARHEIRPARVLLLVPLALALMWGFNLVRIVTLVAIGDAGHPEVALNGFHTEAGWITLNLVSMAFLVAVQHTAWFRRPVPVLAAAGGASGVAVGPPAPPTADAGQNLAAVYLLPFLAITAASLVGQSLASGFEWLYPLRLVAAAAALWWFRGAYRRMNWRFGWQGIVAGTVIGLFWIGAYLFTQGVRPGIGSAGDPLAISLGHLPTAERLVWLVCRVVAAVVTVPIAEELAFRGFLARRMMAADVEAVPYARLTTLAIAVSSVAFGAMHGSMWAPGMIAGVVFALVARWRDRLGEAVAAHAVSNLLIAVFVLARGDFRLW